MNELREKAKKQRIEFYGESDSRSYSDDEITLMVDFIQSQPINKELEKWKKDHKDLLKLYMDGDDRIKELEKGVQADKYWLENQTQIATHLKSKIKELEKKEKAAFDAMTDEQGKNLDLQNQITQLQKEIEKYEEAILNYLKANDLNRGRDLFKAVEVFKSLTNKTDEQ